MKITTNPLKLYFELVGSGTKTLAFSTAIGDPQEQDRRHPHYLA